jgi:hypothetical protein
VTIGGTFTTTSATYAALTTLTIDLPPGTKAIVVNAGIAFTSSLISDVFARVTVNGVATRSAALTVGIGDLGTISIVNRQSIGSLGLVAGPNTIALEWRRTAGTITINPATDGQYAVLIAQAVFN